MKIGIIGAGNMGAAIARGVMQHADDGYSVIISNPSDGKLRALRNEFPLIETTTSNLEAATGVDMLILAVKPWLLPQVIAELAEIFQLQYMPLVSIAGGVGLDDLKQMFDDSQENPFCRAAQQYFHVIPDTAIAVGKGMTFISSLNASAEAVENVARVFALMGETSIIEERLMGAATALSSCGIAYVYKYIQASVQAGVQLGFYPDKALEYTLATVEGAAAMLRAHHTLPQQEIDRVTTPGGMTIRGINSLERDGFTPALINAIIEPLKK